MRKYIHFGLYLISIQINYDQPYFRNVIYILAIYPLSLGLFFTTLRKRGKIQKGEQPNKDILQP